MKRLTTSLGLALALLVAACTDREPSSTRTVTEVADPADVIDEELMHALAQAKNFHQKAKVYRSDDNLPAATAAVRQILSLRFPANAPEAEDVRNDARALLGKLLYEQGQFDEAMRTVTEGIAQSSRESFFVANLYTVKGEIHHAKAKALAAATPPGAPEQIKAESHAAIDALEKSNLIIEALQKKLIKERR